MRAQHRVESEMMGTYTHSPLEIIPFPRHHSTLRSYSFACCVLFIQCTRYYTFLAGYSSPTSQFAKKKKKVYGLYE